MRRLLTLAAITAALLLPTNANAKDATTCSFQTVEQGSWREPGVLRHGPPFAVRSALTRMTRAAIERRIGSGLRMTAEIQG